MHCFGVIWSRISDPRSVWIMVYGGTDESTLVMESPVPLMHHDPDRSRITDHDPNRPKGTHSMPCNEPMRVQSKTRNWRHARENTCRYLLLAEFEVRTETYRPSFLTIDLWPKRTGHKSKLKNEDPYLTLQTEKTGLLRYLLHLYCVPDGFGKDFYSCGTASDF